VALYALHATASSFFMPAATALVPQLAPRERLQQVNALRVHVRRPFFVAGMCFFATCAAPLLLALPGPVWSIALAYVGEGFAVGIFVTSWETALQSHIPREMLARVGAWDWLGTIGGMPLGFALTGPIVDAVGTSATLVGVSVAAFLLSLVFVLIRDLRELRVEGPGSVKAVGVPGA
jgi:MFS family permease